MNAITREAGRSDIALLLLRVVVGVVFVAHGAQKFGLFGGDLGAMANAMASFGLEPGVFFAVLAGALEVGGGLLLLVGLITPLAGLILAGVMVVAIALVTGRSGFIAADGTGYEYNLVLLAVALALAIGGPGRLSLDHRLGFDWARGGRIRQMRQGVASR